MLLADDLIRERGGDSWSGISAEAHRARKRLRRKEALLVAHSRNERARGVLFESKRTSWCGSSAMAAMAVLEPARERLRSELNRCVLVKWKILDAH